jgi:RimJ/RimL family protein N-acetyltransferase
VPVDPELRTPRLSLRRWQDADRAPFAVLNADPVVMEHFPAPLRDPADDFDNPNVPEDDALRPHVLYRLDRATWLRNAAQAER